MFDMHIIRAGIRELTVMLKSKTRKERELFTRFLEKESQTVSGFLLCNLLLGSLGSLVTYPLLCKFQVFCRDHLLDERNSDALSLSKVSACERVYSPP